MTVSTLGELSFTAQIPLLAAFKAGLDVSVGFAQPDIEAKLSGLNNVLAAITVAPPDLQGTIAAAVETVAQLRAAVGGPTVTLEAEAIAALIADLTIQLDQITAAAALTVPDGALTVYVYDGASGSLGSELQTAINASLPGAPGRAYALVFVTTSSADWSAAGGVYRTS